MVPPSCEGEFLDVWLFEFLLIVNNLTKFENFQFSFVLIVKAREGGDPKTGLKPPPGHVLKLLGPSEN